MKNKDIDRELYAQIEPDWNADYYRRLARIYARWAKLLRTEAKKESQPNVLRCRFNWN